MPGHTRNRRLAAALAADHRPGYVIAGEAGIIHQRIGGFVSGRVEPTDDEQRRIAAVLGYPVEALFADTPLEVPA